MRPATRLLAWVYTGPIGHLYGGMADWAAAGRPLVSETGRPPVVV